MRLFLVLLLALAVVVGGCGGDDDSGSSTGADASATTTETTPSELTETSPAETTETEQGGDDADAGDQDGDSTGGSDSGDDSSSGGGSGGTAASDDDRESATAAVTDFYTALSSGDGDKACDLMGDAVKKQFTQQLAQAQNKQGASCETLAGGITEAYPAQIRDRLAKLRVVKVTVNGDKAVVTAKIPGTPASQLPLERDGDSWNIQAPVGGATP